MDYEAKFLLEFAAVLQDDVSEGMEQQTLGQKSHFSEAIE